MKKLRSSSILLIFIVLAGCLAVGAKAIPGRARATLLSLYTRSDAVMIGRFDKKEDSGTNRVGDGFTIVTTKTFFDISTVLKGDPRKFVVIEGEEFRYQVAKGNTPSRDAVFSVGLDATDVDNMPKPGDTVLLFLRSEGDSLILVDERDGVRKISAADEAVYTDRIKELNSIFENGETDPSKIAAWLVRCAAQRATRWDGTHELMQGFRHLEGRDQKNPDGYDRIDPTVSYVLGADAAKVLSDEFKNTLTGILVSSDFNITAQSGQLSDGDRELIALVKRWDPKTAADYLLSQLKSRAFTARENIGMMYKISELIGDGRSTEITRVYNQAASTDVNESSAKHKQLARIVDDFVRNAENELSTSTSSQTN